METMELKLRISLPIEGQGIIFVLRGNRKGRKRRTRDNTGKLLNFTFSQITLMKLRFLILPICAMFVAGAFFSGCTTETTPGTTDDRSKVLSTSGATYA